jgi:quinolinate synthase
MILREDVLLAKEEHPGALVLSHPECRSEAQEISDFCGSARRYAAQSPARSMIIGTEVGILHRLRKDNPRKQFFPAYEGAMCPNMKKNI